MHTLDEAKEMSFVHGLGEILLQAKTDLLITEQPMAFFWANGLT